MTHTTYYGILEGTSGHRLVNQVGTFSYNTASSLTSRISIGFHKLVAALISSNGTLASNKTAMLANQISFVGSAQITQQLDRVVVVARKTGNITGVYSYSFYGY